MRTALRKREEAQALLEFSASVARHRIVRGRMVVLENPWSSGLWNWQPLCKQLRRLGCERHEAHLCAYGAAWKKPTGLSSNVPGFASAIRRCPGCRRHVALQCTVFVEGAGWHWRTSYAAAYPPASCSSKPPSGAYSPGRELLRDST